MSHAALLTLLALTTAAPPDGSTREWGAMRERLARDRVRTRFLRREEVSILKGLRTLDRSIAKREKRLGDLLAKTARIEEQAAERDRRVAENEAELGRLRAVAARRVAAMIKLRKTRIGDLLRHATRPTEARKLRDRLRFVLAYDRDLVSSTRQASAADRALRADLEARKEELAGARAEIEIETEAALALRDDRAALLDAIRNERRASERLARELLETARRFERERGVLHGATPAPEPAPGGFGLQRGRLPWPVPGSVEAPFGKKVDPPSGMVMAHEGLDIRAPPLTPIRAVFAAQVAYAAWLDGYGRVLILDHGDRWYSVYAHLESFQVRTKMKVNQHQVIGFVGDSGSRKGAYLYFEIRRGQEAVDPGEWLAR